MNFLAQAIIEFFNKETINFEFNFTAKIVSFDPLKMRAVISPQLTIRERKTLNAGLVDYDLPDMRNVPCEMIYSGNGYFIRPDYAAGDLVSVKSYATPLNAPLQGQRADRMKGRFSLSSCTVTAGVIPDAFTAPAAFSKPGLIIGKGSKYIWFDGAAIHTNGDLKVDGKITATGDITSDGTVTGKTDVLAGPAGKSGATHVHAVTTAPGTTAPPT